MDTNQLKAAILSYTNDQLEVRECGQGFMLWLPTRFADDDAVCLSVTPNAGGWTVSDDGTTLSRLLESGVAQSSAPFEEGWRKLARPGVGFILGDDPDDGSIAAAGEEVELPRLVNAVASAALRAEGLEFLGRPRQVRTFASRVTDRVTKLAKRLPSDYELKPNGRVRMVSGRERRMTATLLHGGDVALAVQAVGGANRQARMDNHDTCYAAFGPSGLPKDQCLAVAVGRKDAWEQDLIAELAEVANVVYYDDALALEQTILRTIPATDAAQTLASSGASPPVPKQIGPPR